MPRENFSVLKTHYAPELSEANCHEDSVIRYCTVAEYIHVVMLASFGSLTKEIHTVATSDTHMVTGSTPPPEMLRKNFLSM